MLISCLDTATAANGTSSNRRTGRAIACAYLAVGSYLPMQPETGLEIPV
jgi:hypothetical protein